MTQKFEPGQWVRVQAPQGSAFDGFVGTVKEVLPFDGTVLVDVSPAWPVLPFGNGELVPANFTDAMVAGLRELCDKGATRKEGGLQPGADGV